MLVNTPKIKLTESEETAVFYVYLGGGLYQPALALLPNKDKELVNYMKDPTSIPAPFRSLKSDSPEILFEQAYEEKEYAEASKLMGKVSTDITGRHVQFAHVSVMTDDLDIAIQLYENNKNEITKNDLKTWVQEYVKNTDKILDKKSKVDEYNTIIDRAN